MSKRTLIVSGALAAIILVGGGWAVLTQTRGQKSLFSPAGTSKTTAEKEETYTDTSGFSFKHPESISVSDKTPDDDAYYTLLSLESKTKKDGSLTITIMDTKFKTTAEWLANDAAVAHATLSGATSLGGISAKQYTKSGTSWTVAVEGGILYLIEVPRDDVYWNEVHELVVSSFTLSKPQAAESTTGGSDAGAIYEEEEVIE